MLSFGFLSLSPAPAKPPLCTSALRYGNTTYRSWHFCLFGSGGLIPSLQKHLLSSRWMPCVKSCGGACGAPVSAFRVPLTWLSGIFSYCRICFGTQAGGNLFPAAWSQHRWDLEPRPQHEGAKLLTLRGCRDAADLNSCGCHGMWGAFIIKGKKFPFIAITVVWIRGR